MRRSKLARDFAIGKRRCRRESEQIVVTNTWSFLETLLGAALCFAFVLPYVCRGRVSVCSRAGVARNFGGSWDRNVCDSTERGLSDSAKNMPAGHDTARNPPPGNRHQPYSIMWRRPYARSHDPLLVGLVQPTPATRDRMRELMKYTRGDTIKPAHATYEGRTPIYTSLPH
jgi:hypothetical protein